MAALSILPVARLLSDQHHGGGNGTLAEDGLRAQMVQVAPGADLGGVLEGAQREPRREEDGRGGMLGRHGGVVPDALRPTRRRSG